MVWRRIFDALTQTTHAALTSSPMEMLEHLRPFSPWLTTPFLQCDVYVKVIPSGSLLFSRITSEDSDCQAKKNQNKHKTDK